MDTNSWSDSFEVDWQISKRFPIYEASAALITTTAAQVVRLAMPLRARHREESARQIVLTKQSVISAQKGRPLKEKKNKKKRVSRPKRERRNEGLIHGASPTQTHTDTMAN